MRSDRSGQQRLLIIVLVATLLAASCSSDGDPVPSEEGSAGPPSETESDAPSQPLISSEAQDIASNFEIPDDAVDGFTEPLDVGPEPTDLGLSADIGEPLFIYVLLTMASGEITLACDTTGQAGRLEMALDADGLVEVRQDRGDGPVVVDSDTMNPRDVPAEGDPVLLGLLCGENPDGTPTLALSIDALGVQFITSPEGQIGEDTFSFTVSGDAATRVFGAFSIAGRDALGFEDE